MSAKVIPHPRLCTCGHAIASVLVHGGMACEACAPDRERAYAATQIILTLPAHDSMPLSDVLTKLVQS